MGLFGLVRVYKYTSDRSVPGFVRDPVGICTYAGVVRCVKGVKQAGQAQVRVVWEKGLGGGVCGRVRGGRKRWCKSIAADSSAQ